MASSTGKTAAAAGPRALPVQPDSDPVAVLDPSEEDDRADLDEQITGAEADALGAPVPTSEGPGTDGGTESDDVRVAREQLERRLADGQLIEVLRRGGFEGARYEYFAGDLAQYGLSVMRGWLHTGYVFTLLSDRGRPVVPEPWELEELALDSTARDELAVMTVAIALARFRARALIGGAWDPAKGASITTYFMGACVLAFANTFKERRRRRARWARQDDKDGVTYDRHRLHEDPTTVVVGRQALRQRLSQYKERDRRIIAASLVGYSQEEIAEMYAETSARAVEGVLYRWRTQEKKHINNEGVAGS